MILIPMAVAFFTSELLCKADMFKAVAFNFLRCYSLSSARLAISLVTTLHWLLWQHFLIKYKPSILQLSFQFFFFLNNPFLFFDGKSSWGKIQVVIKFLLGLKNIGNDQLIVVDYGGKDIHRDLLLNLWEFMTMMIEGEAMTADSLFHRPLIPVALYHFPIMLF